MNRKFSFSDTKIKKSIISLRYMAYTMIFVIFFLGIGVSTYQGINIIQQYKSQSIKIISWLIVFYTTTIFIILGIKDVLRLLANLEKDNIFTYENANIIKRIDNKLLITLFFSVIINIVFVLAEIHDFNLLIIWGVFTGFILIAHVLVKPLYLLVEKSAEMQIEMDLTI